jgi:hypothetical protein
MTRNTTTPAKKASDNNAHYYGQIPVIAGIARHCGLRPANSSSKKKRRTTHPTITDNVPSLRALRVIAGYDPQTAAAKKNVGQQCPPSRTNPRRCGL